MKVKGISSSQAYSEWAKGTTFGPKLKLQVKQSALKESADNEDVDEAFNLDIGTKVAIKSNGKMIYGKVIGKEKVMGKPGVEVKWSSGGKGRFSNDQFAALSMDKKADYVISESVELDEAEYQGKKVKLNSPKRGGSKKYYVYTKNKKDKTKAGYWACRTPRYKSLGVKGGQWW